MAIYAQSKLATPYMGHYGPVNLYRGGQKISGWSWAERQGAVLEFEDTYNDAVIGTITGRSEQAVTVQGKNLLPYPYTEMSYTKNGVTITVNNDGTLLYNGTATASVAIDLFRGKMYLTPGTRYYLKDINVQLNGISGNNMTSGYMAQNGDWISLVWRWYPAGTVFNNVVFYPMLQVDTVVTTYEPFVPNSPSPDYPSPILMAGNCNIVSQSADGSKSSSIAIPEIGSLPNGVKDTLTYKGGGMWEHVQRVGRIASYNGETITGAYMSTTGALSVGAEVIYELAAPITTMLNLGELRSFPHYTKIHQDTTGLKADLSLKTRVVDKEV